MTDHHYIWRVVGRNFAALHDNAPEGYAPTVRVYLIGEAVPLSVRRIETHQENSWTMLLAVEEGGDRAAVDSGVKSSDRWVFVEAGHVARVEISFVRKGSAPVGFRVDTVDRPDENSPIALD